MFHSVFLKIELPFFAREGMEKWKQTDKALVHSPKYLRLLNACTLERNF